MAATAEAMRASELRDFSGGPNLRDSGPELGANEVADAWNVTFDERGGAASRLGYQQQNESVFAGGPVSNMFWSVVLGKRLTQAGTNLYLADDGVNRHTFTTTDTAQFAETNAAVLALHPIDGLYSSADGITWTAIAAAPKGTCITVWQNKVYIGETTGKLSWSGAGDPTTWSATDFVELWELDQQGIVALHVGSGQDIQGRPGLLVFKQDSFYRVNDSSTGSYTTVDASVGCAGPKAVVGVGARVCFVGKHGVFWWREDQAEAVNAGDKLRPLWQPSALNLNTLAGWAAGRIRDRALFSVALSGSSVNNLALELHPDMGWIAPRSDAMSCYATSAGGDESVYGGSPSVSGQTYLLGVGGADDGAAISWRLQTRWLELNNGFDAYLWQARVQGRGTGTMTVRTDYADSGGSQYPFALTGDLPLYDTGLLYDSGLTYGTEALQQTEPFYSLGRCRQFSLVFAGSSTDTVAAPSLFGIGVSPQVGSFGLTGVEYLYTQLGLS